MTRYNEQKKGNYKWLINLWSKILKFCTILPWKNWTSLGLVGDLSPLSGNNLLFQRISCYGGYF